LNNERKQKKRRGKNDGENKVLNAVQTISLASVGFWKSGVLVTLDNHLAIMA
jgi:hypothetical protein